jgi:hypothetical protein
MAKSKFMSVMGVILVILLVVVVQYFKGQSKNEPDSENNTNKQGTEQRGSFEAKTPESAPNGEGQLSGTLKISDDLKRGNLMLITSDRAIYLFTSRDYSTLFDKEVYVEIEGDFESFRLVDIVAK